MNMIKVATAEFYPRCARLTNKLLNYQPRSKVSNRKHALGDDFTIVGAQLVKHFHEPRVAPFTCCRSEEDGC